jgi:diadenosine tetraphosphate (Ap4A) HIT family hydrolase
MNPKDCELCARVAQARAGEHPYFITELPETEVILGDNQGCAGWCVAILREHQEHMAELSVERQGRIFEDVARVASAIRAVVGPVRINYECLGNQVPHIHWHLIPRHKDDPTPRLPVWGWPAEQLRGTMTDSQRQALALKIREALT